jgi:hypothetical protein
MIDMRNLPEEIARLDLVIESFEAQLNEIRQQREFKMALLRQLQDRELTSVSAMSLVQQRTDVVSE